MYLLHYPALFLKHSTEGTHTSYPSETANYLFNLPNVLPVFPIFCTICFIFVIQSGYLTGIDALSAFRQEEDCYVSHLVDTTLV